MKFFHLYPSNELDHFFSSYVFYHLIYRFDCYDTIEYNLRKLNLKIKS